LAHNQPTGKYTEKEALGFYNPKLF